MEELLSLKWNNHRSTFLNILRVIRDKQLYTDATLACEGMFYSVHRLVLSTCSDYFSAMFDRTTCKNPVIVLKDIKCEDLESLLDYMYLGEVNVRQTDLASLIKSAECLQVKGLAVPDDEPNKKSGRSEGTKRIDSSPAPKRKRRAFDDGSRPTHSSISATKNISSQMLSSAPLDKDIFSMKNDSEKFPETPFVKVEIEDSSSDVEKFEILDDGYKQEARGDGVDPGGELSNDLPDFHQHSSDSQGQSSYTQGSFPGTSFLSDDLPDWQGEGSNMNYSELNYDNEADGSNQNVHGKIEMDLSAVTVKEEAFPMEDDCSSTGQSYCSTETAKTCETSESKKSFCCPFCHINIKWRSNYSRHVRTHKGVKPFSCVNCPYRATRRADLRRHAQSCIRRKITDPLENS